MNRIAVAAYTASAAHAVPAVMRALAATLVALALLPASANAHTVLTTTTPERGARLDAAPEQVTLRFSEPVETEFGAVRVFDAAGREVQSGGAFHPDGRASEVAVRLREGLGEDGYAATYRVLSADSHPVSGGFVFVVGDAAMPATTVGELLGDNDTGAVTGTALGVARAVSVRGDRARTRRTHLHARVLAPRPARHRRSPPRLG